MTREEWQDKLEETLMEADEGYGKVIDYDIVKEARRVIGYLIDDIESRICGNCAYYNVWEMCGNEDSPLNHVNFSLDKDFSCPYFTKADDER